MANEVKVLIAEDEPHALMGLAELISGWGYRTETARDGIEAWEKALAWEPAIVVTDLKMPRLDGIGLLTKLAEYASGVNSSMAVVVLTAMGSIQLAVDAMKLGAYDFLQKPVDATRLRTILANATRQRDTAIELEIARRRLRESGVLGAMVGSSKAMREIFGLIEQIAPSNVSVLITGESGTGKELVARTLHALSPRKARPFVAVNCAAIPETLIESELFGHEKGAFTGAAERRAGCFELASGGTLMLDEIGEMPVATQAKLLRVLEERKLRRLGARTEQDVDVRVLAATNRDPGSAVELGHLRADLYYRLNVFNIHMPALRDHIEDLPAMAEAMVSEMNQKHGRKVSGLASSMLDRMMSYDWPGNARELRNTIERAVILCPDGAPLDAGHLPPGFGKSPHRACASSSDAGLVPVHVGTTVDEAERMLILRTLEATGQNKTRAAEILGVSLKTLHNKLKEYSRTGATNRPDNQNDNYSRSTMRLKTKLVLAITGLVFLIAGLISLVYVGQLVHEAVRQSYDNNLGWRPSRSASPLQTPFENGLRDQKVDPNNYLQLRFLEAQAVRSDASLQDASTRPSATRPPSTTSTSATPSPASCSAPTPAAKTSRCRSGQTISSFSTTIPPSSCSKSLAPPRSSTSRCRSNATAQLFAISPCRRAHHAAGRGPTSPGSSKPSCSWPSLSALGCWSPSCSPTSPFGPWNRSASSSTTGPRPATLEKRNLQAPRRSWPPVSPARSRRLVSACAMSKKSSRP